MNGSKIHYVLLGNDCSIRVYQSFPMMLALCLMLSVTYYAQNYAGILGWPWSLLMNIASYIWKGSFSTSYVPYLIFLITDFKKF